MQMVAYIINQVISIYIFVIFISVVMSWLFQFGVINMGNNLVAAIYRTCNMVTEPLLTPIRNMLPNMGGIDFSPLVLLIGMNALQIGLNAYVFGPLIQAGL